MRLALALVAALLCVQGQPTRAQAPPSALSWRVDNRFPVLTNGAFRDVEKAWNDSKEQSMWRFIVHRLKTVEEANGQQYVLVDPKLASPAPGAATTNTVSIRLETGPSPEGNCSWTVQPAPVKAPRDGQCFTTAVIARNTPTTVTVRRGAEVSTAVIDVDEIVVVAMGDSYSSGEGSPDMPAKYEGFDTPPRNNWFLAGGVPSRGKVVPAEWFDETCHRSLLSWPVLASLRLALEHPKAVVRLVNVTCSGAEFMDGLFVAQEKAPILGRTLASSRDGTGRRYVRSDTGRYLPQSQVNSVRGALCQTTMSELEDISTPDDKFIAVAQRCMSPNFPPDVLLLSAGGNDIRFSSAVLGVLMPSVARVPFTGPLLAGTRSVAGAIPPEKLAKNAKRMTETYSDYMRLVAWGAGVEPSRTVVIAYPNPVALNTKPGQWVCQPFNERLKNSFLVFGPAAREASPWFVRPFMNWAIELGIEEEHAFVLQAYPAVETMQRTIKGTFKLVDWHPQHRSGEDERRSFSTRLLCSAEPEGSGARARQDALEPIFFCQVNAKECEKSPYTYRASLSQWKFSAPDRRMVNSANDALLAQRSWDAKASPSDDELFAAMSGTFHPVPESHAVAADSAYAEICSVLRSRPHKDRDVCGSGPTRDRARPPPP